MNCPKCNGVMDTVASEGVEVDRCSDCAGIWFDRLEHQDLKTLSGSDAIDTGDPQKGAELNKLGKIDCPVCHTQMIRMVDVDQPHIWYEGCTVCDGVFFDAGEFKDFKNHTLADIFRDLLAKERK